MLQHTDTKLPCSSDPEMWFESKDKLIQKEAIEACGHCPLALRCLEQCLELEALLGHTVDGIHAGTTPAQRRKLQGKFKRIA